MSSSRWSRPLGFCFAICAGCGGPSLRGAVAIEDSRALGAALRGELVPGNCRDGRDAPVDAPALRVERVVLSDGREALLELRAGYDSVLVTNVHREARGLVFQYVSDDGQQGGKILHVLRFPPTVPGPVLERFDAFDVQGSANDFRATARQAILTCKLDFPAPSAQPAQPTALPPAGSR